MNPDDHLTHTSWHIRAVNSSEQNFFFKYNQGNTSKGKPEYSITACASGKTVHLNMKDGGENKSCRRGYVTWVRN